MWVPVLSKRSQSESAPHTKSKLNELRETNVLDFDFIDNNSEWEPLSTHLYSVASPETTEKATCGLAQNGRKIHWWVIRKLYWVIETNKPSQCCATKMSKWEIYELKIKIENSLSIPTHSWICSKTKQFDHVRQIVSIIFGTVTVSRE